jgi:putative membrane protein
MSDETVALNIGNNYKEIKDNHVNKASFFTYPDILRVKGSVLFNILPQVSFMMLFAGINVLISKYHYNLALPNSISNKI